MTERRESQRDNKPAWFLGTLLVGVVGFYGQILYDEVREIRRAVQEVNTRAETALATVQNLGVRVEQLERWRDDEPARLFPLPPVRQK